MVRCYSPEGFGIHFISCRSCSPSVLAVELVFYTSTCFRVSACDDWKCCNVVQGTGLL